MRQTSRRWSLRIHDGRGRAHNLSLGSASTVVETAMWNLVSGWFYSWHLRRAASDGSVACVTSRAGIEIGSFWLSAMMVVDEKVAIFCHQRWETTEIVTFGGEICAMFPVPFRRGSSESPRDKQTGS